MRFPQTATPAACCLAMSAAAALADTWDPSLQFTPSVNPGPVWSYGYQPSGAGTFATFPDRYDTAQPPTLSLWHRNLPFPESYPAVGANTADATVLWSGVNPVGPRHIVLHPGALPAVLRFTAPLSATYTVNLQLSRTDPSCPGGSGRVTIVAGSALATRVLTNGEDPWQSTVTVGRLAGETIDFVADNHDGSINCDHIQGRIAITTGGCGPADIGATGGTAAPAGDGVLDNNDFVVFIDYFFSGHPSADRGRTGGQPGSDGLFNNNDFIVFIDQFFAGC